MGIKQELGKKIKRMRINRGLTQEKLAELVDISQRTLSGIESGENFVTAETLDKLVLALNITSEELFATNHLRSKDEIIADIIKSIDIISEFPDKLNILYNVAKALSKE